MLSQGQVVAVRGAFSLAGYDGDLRTLPVTSEDKRIFELPQDDVLALRDVRTLEQVLQRVLGRCRRRVKTDHQTAGGFHVTSQHSCQRKGMELGRRGRKRRLGIEDEDTVSFG